MLQQPRGEWGNLSAKLLSESKQKFDAYLSRDGAAPSQAHVTTSPNQVTEVVLAMNKL